MNFPWNPVASMVVGAGAVVAEDEPPVAQRVKVGMSDGTWTEVLSGLNEGDWIARRVFTIQKTESGFSFTSGMPNGGKPPPKK